MGARGDRRRKNATRNMLDRKYWIGSKELVEETKVKQGISANGRRIDEKRDGLCVLRERSMRYNADSDPENGALTVKNAFFWDYYCANSAI